MSRGLAANRAAVSARLLGGAFADLIGPGDYPAAARRAGEQGDVTVRLLIGPDGRALRCTILAADTSASLQATTCALLLGRARFAPATAATGAPVPDTTIGHIAWRLP